MRTMMRIQIPTEAGNKAIADGSLPELMERMMTELKPEAAYFLSEDGMRTAYVVFDLADTSQIPIISEPIFQGIDAMVGFRPVMNADDLMKALAQLGS